ncbi:MAG: amino acid racemase [Alphaproteobacteria bacterium]
MCKKIKIGLIGGMSYHSTLDYYWIINEEVNKVRGGFRCANLLISSVDFAPIEGLMRQGDWSKIVDLLTIEAKRLEAAGATHLVMCTNTMHKIVSEIEKQISIKFIHIVDATAEKLLEDGVKKVALLGTRFVMQEDFYKKRLEGKFGIEVVVPDEDGIKAIDNVIFNELCKGKVCSGSRNIFAQNIDSNVDAVILGCTEIVELFRDAIWIGLSNGNCIPLYDTTGIHAKAVANLILKN